MASKQELAIIYAALILEDEGVSITTEKINKLLQAAGVQVSSVDWRFITCNLG
jgi:ribosomal protein L12E/L44/L45/RPP1/RPP2